MFFYVYAPLADSSQACWPVFNLQNQTWMDQSMTTTATTVIITATLTLGGK